jgi:moderate conductance mechanosensitive channel
MNFDQAIDQLTVDWRFVDSVVFKAILLLAIAIVLLFIYRHAGGAIHRVTVGILSTQQKAMTEGGAPPAELAKRAVTLETLLGKLVRAGVIIAVICVILSVFDLWGSLAGIGLIAAALTLAGQSIVLDFLMGILILIEGEFFTGDWIVVDAGNGPIDGEVKEVGLRRTVLRDITGAEHSISNGLIRVSTNQTRVFAMATVELQVIRAQEMDQALSVIGEVGNGMAADPDWASRFLDGPPTAVVTALTVDGATVRVRARVAPEDRWVVAAELRRRIAVALGNAGVATVRWDAFASASPQALAAAATALPNDGSPAP